MHNHSALRVTNIIDHLVSMVMNILKGSWQVINSHFMKSVVPESIVINSESLVFLGVIITSHVAYPDIEALISIIEGRSHVFIRTGIDNPAIRRVHQTMLQVHHRQIFLHGFLSFGLDTEVG